MQIQIGQFEFVQTQLDDSDGLDYDFYWQAFVPAASLTTWGRGSEQLGAEPLPITCLQADESPLLQRQVAAAQWLLKNLDSIVSLIQSACEDAWSACYYWEGNEMTDEDEYYITGIRIPPGEAPPWGEPRDPSLPALIVVDMEQDWELEHGFYVVLDPATGTAEWTTWDGLQDKGLVRDIDEDEDEDFGDEDDFDEDEDGFDEDDFDDE